MLRNIFMGGLMAKIHFLGTCSGTEPIKDMHHCSFVLEHKGINYWFDAGENCAYSAHISGIDLLATRALFISHPHLDHTGGLANLLGCMNKLVIRESRTLVNNNTLEAFLPDLDVFFAAKVIATGNLPFEKLCFNINEHRISDGTLYEDENIRVSAIHNRHLKGDDGKNGWRSFSFLIECDGKRIVFSGDVDVPYELDPLVEGGVDMLIMETGHHPVSAVCEYALSRNVRNLCFNHHGREIINDRAAAEKLIADYESRGSISVKLCYDGMIQPI